METLRGIGVSPGIVIGRAFVLDDEHRRIARRTVAQASVDVEQQRLSDAIAESLEELRTVEATAKRELGQEAAKIFGFHIGMLSDPSLSGPMLDKIGKDRVCAEYAVDSVFRELAARFGAMRDSAFTTKVNDVHDLSSRVLRHLIGEHKSALERLSHEAVVLARDLTPSQTAAFDREKVVALSTELGGRTSHTAIVARALELPAVVGVENLMSVATDGVRLIVDGDRGLVIIDPDDATIEEYRRSMEQRRLFDLSLDEISALPSVTIDGEPVKVMGNIEFSIEAKSVLSSGGEGVGLYRSEFLYLTRDHEPTEEEHFEAYGECVRLLEGKPCVIRTFDLGADKHTQATFVIPERNPFLGLRSIRYSMRAVPMFKRQIRAILRASALGPVSVMFPLITSLSEFRAGKLLIADVMEDLADEGIAFDETIRVGMMVEVPSAALMASTFAREADFFSIGTNDLVQYTLAVDRTNERVAHMYTPYHPAVLRLIRDVLRAGKRYEVPVSCCGEAAGEIEFALLLIGMGARTLSVSPGLIPRLKRMVRSVRRIDCERIAKRALTFDSDAQVSAYTRDQARQIVPEAFGGRAAEAG